MHPIFAPVTVVNLILCIMIVIMSIIGYFKIRSTTPLFIGVAFFLFGVSHVATILGPKTALLEPAMIIVRTLGYITVCVGVYLIIREIILRMKTEGELRTERLGLERRVDERTAELQQANEALQQSEQRYRLLFETAREGILVAQGGSLKFINPMTLELTGHTEEELMSLPFLEFVHHDDRELVRSNHLKRTKGETVDPICQFRLLQKDRSMKWVEMTGVNIEWEGQPASLNFVTDITERKRAEEQIQQRNQELAHLNDELVGGTAALEDANATITRIAATDYLTGLANRRCLYESLKKAVSLARRHGSPLALVSLDLDGLKRVNDSAGHEAGDEVLTGFADLLGSLCRTEDLPARLGGDEFSLLLPGIDLGGARGLAERALAAVRSCAALEQRGVTVSGGVAALSPDELPDDLLRRADEALYAAKRGGGNSVAADA